MGVIERVKEIVLVPPREMVFDILMKVLFNSRIGFLMIAFECEEIVASLLQDLLGDMGLASHGLDSDNASFDQQQLQQVRNRGDLIGFAVGLQLANDETAVLRTPGREHVQGRGRRGPVKGGFHRFAIQRDKAYGQNIQTHCFPISYASP